MTDPAAIAARLTEEPVTVCIDRDTLGQLVALLRECAEDLEEYVNAEYPMSLRDGYPSLERRYLRDMEPVSRARAVLDRLAPLLIAAEREACAVEVENHMMPAIYQSYFDDRLAHIAAAIRERSRQ